MAKAIEALQAWRNEDHADSMILSRHEVITIVTMLDLAQQVRAAQKKYFKTRNRNDLVACKQLESQLDKALADG